LVTPAGVQLSKGSQDGQQGRLSGQIAQNPGPNSNRTGSELAIICTGNQQARKEKKSRNSSA